MRKIYFTDNELIKDVISKKDAIVKEILAIGVENDELQKKGNENLEKFNKLSAKLERLNEKIVPEVEREYEPFKKDIGEFEEIGNVVISKGAEDEGKLYLEVHDRLEEFKSYYAERKAKKDNGGDTTQNVGGDNTDKTEPAPVVEVGGDTR